MLHRVLIVGALAAALSATACGDDKPPPQQAVLWFGLDAAAGASCSSNKVYQYPDDTARATVSGSSAVGERAKDGAEYLVECDVRAASGSTSNYNVDLKFQGGEIGNFVASGVLTDGAAAGMQGTLDVTVVTGQFSLSQRECSVNVETLVPGALWLRSLRCNDLRDPSSPSIACDGQGALIFENCSH